MLTSPERFFEGLAIVDAESVGHSTGKASLVLIKANHENWRGF